jgi:hypothetical protein
LFFTLHPLRVEAVAWASARADPVAATFIFLSLLCYLRATNTPAYRTWMIAAWVSGQIWGQVLFLEFRASPC